jgi:hypothetical protein
VQASKILPTIYPFYGVIPSVGTILDTLIVKNASPYHHLHFNTSIDDGQSVVLK